MDIEWNSDEFFNHPDAYEMMCKKLEDGANPNARCKNRKMPLSRVIFSQHSPDIKDKMIKALFKHGVDFDMHYEIGDAILADAISSDYMQNAKTMLSLGASPDISTSDSRRAAQFAAAYGDVDMIDELGCRDVNMNAWSKDGERAIHFAFHDFKEEKDTHYERMKITVRALVRNGADLNIGDYGDNTFLHEYFERYVLDKIEISFLKELISLGADPRKLNKEGESPIDIYKKHNPQINQDILNILENAPPIDQVNKNFAWNTRAFFENTDIDGLRLALDRGADPNAKDKYGKTVLDRAIIFGDLDMVKLLIDRGAKIFQVDIFGDTQLHHAVRANKFDIVKYLIDLGYSIHAKGYRDSLPLHEAAKFADTAINNHLLEMGSSITQKDAGGDTYLHFINRRRYASEEPDKIFEDRPMFIPSVIIDSLVEDYGKDILNMTNSAGDTILHEAARRRAFDDYLISLKIRGGDMDMKNNEGETALDILKTMNPECIDMLNMYNHINKDDNEGHQPV